MRSVLIQLLLFIGPIQICSAQTLDDVYDPRKPETIIYNREFIKKHKIKQIEIRETFAGRRSVNLNSFDADGKLVSFISSDSARVFLHNEFTYDRQGHLVTLTSFNRDGSADFDQHFFRKYSGNKLIKDSCELCFGTTYFSYDSRGRNDTVIFIIGKAISTEKKIKEYDDRSGKLVKVTTKYFDSYTENRIGSIRKYIYNSKNELVKEEELLPDNMGNPPEHGNIAYEYDSIGMLIKKTENYGMENIYKYDDNKLLTGQEKIAFGKVKNILGDYKKETTWLYSYYR